MDIVENFMNLKNSIKRNLYYVPLIFFVIPIVYSLFKWTFNYWDNAMGNWLATMLGILGGIPIAIWLNNQNTIVEQKKLESKEKQKEKEILLLIKEELQFNLDRLNDRISNTNKLHLHPFKSDLWDAISDSGEIKYISNPNLLNRVASAYHIIKIVERLERLCYENTRGIASALVSDDGKKPAQLILEDARTFDKQNKKNIAAALKYIQIELN